ncbi:MAG: pyridoxal-phosphate dependent enzyme [Actinomycetota bacterium]|nr:pyridoxal-phosphate dependent enzyme [Actinomycetota bacterium]
MIPGSDVPPTREECSLAAKRLLGRMRKTPVADLPAGDLGLRPVTIKLEFLQYTGAFKARGALNAVLAAPEGVASVSAASGGNHGAAVAWASRQAGAPRGYLRTRLRASSQDLSDRGVWSVPPPCGGVLWGCLGREP